MKKYLYICFFIVIPLSVSAQDVVAAFLDAHAKDDNLQVVSIGKKMMDTICSLSADNPSLTEAIKGLETIRIVSSKNQDLNQNAEYFLSAQTLLTNTKGLKALFSMSEKEKELMVMVKELKGSIKELLLLSEQPDGFNLISLSGTIHLDDLQKYSEGLNIKELNELNSVRCNQ